MLAIFLGWAGIHKFYLGYRNVGFIHVALTAILPITLLAILTTNEVGSVFVVHAAAWVAIIFGYFYVRRLHLGHTVDEAIGPVRLLFWPLLRSFQRLRDRLYWSRRIILLNMSNFSAYLAVILLVLVNVAFWLAIVAAIGFAYYFILFRLVGIIAFSASVVIGVIEGVRYFRKTDSEFQNEYVASRRLWF